MTWHLRIQSRCDPRARVPSTLNYRSVNVSLLWPSDTTCSLICQSPLPLGQENKKELLDSGIRGVLAVDRYWGHVLESEGVPWDEWGSTAYLVYTDSFQGARAYDTTDLMKAAFSNDVRAVEQLMSDGADIEQSDMVGITAACHAATAGAREAFDLLFARGADLRVRVTGGGTLLHFAAAGGSLEILSVLIDNGVDAHARNILGQTARSLAALMGHNDAVAFLSRMGVEP